MLMSTFRTEVKYTQILTEGMLYLKYMTVLNKHKMNGKEQNPQQRVWTKV